MINNPAYRGVVYPWHCDHVGHMNVMWYVGKFDEATWNMFSDLGMTSSWLRDNRRGMAAVEQHITYLRELHAGDVVAINTAILEVKDKSIRFTLVMRNAADHEVCARCDLTALHLDLETRKAVSFSGEIFKALRQAQEIKTGDGE